MDRDLTYIADIVNACDEVATFLGRSSKEEFFANKLVMSAVIRQLEIVGEAAKRLSDAFRETHPAIQWKQMAGLRDVLIHSYEDVDWDLVWDIASTKAPVVRAALVRLLPPTR
jgi:uncharacterized protein with HEPN domain